MKTLYLIGGGGHCKACIDVIELSGAYRIEGIIDLPEKQGQSVLGYAIKGTDADLKCFADKDKAEFLITMGHIKTPHPRRKLFEQLEMLSARLATIVSPRAYVSPHAAIGAGTIVMHGAIINAGATIGNNCIINSHALIEHDAVIHDHCHIATGAIINGGVQVGAQTFIGSGAMTREYIAIGARSFVAGGLNVYRDLPEQSRVKPT